MYGQQPEDEELSHIVPWLIESYHAGARIGAMCTGSFVLAMTGLLDRKIATTNWLFVKKFRRQFPKVILKPERILTEDDTPHYRPANTVPGFVLFNVCEQIRDSFCKHG